MGLRNRRRRRVGGGRRYRGRRGRRANKNAGFLGALIGACIVACVCGAITAYKSVKKDVNKAQKEQDEFVQQRQARRAKRKAKRKAKKQSDLEAKGENAVVNDADVNSDTDNDDDDEDKTLKAAEKERAKEIQEKQTELLKDILVKQSEEDDQDEIDKLTEQQNVLKVQMDKMKAEGYEFEGTLPEVVLWVSNVTKYSSQYQDDRWSASQLEGPPNVYPSYGDHDDAWAPKDIDACQYLELEYKEALYVTSIDVYETFHAGGVKAILGKDSNGQWQQLWKTESVENIEKARIFSPPLKTVDFPIKELRVEVDCSASGSWVELDAVRMSGTKNKK